MKGLLLTISALLIMTSGAFAEKCSGKWGGRAKTSITFKSGQNLRYCYEAQCWNSEWIGSKSSKISFRIGNGGAFVEMKKSGSGYNAVWRNGEQSSKAKLACK